MAIVVDEEVRFPSTSISMNKYIFRLLGAIIAMAFIASCQEQGTTTTATAPAATKSNVKTTGGHTYRNAAPSPTP
jgi:uncharacterized lipoprotein YajG